MAKTTLRNISVRQTTLSVSVLEGPRRPHAVRPRRLINFDIRCRQRGSEYSTSTRKGNV